MGFTVGVSNMTIKKIISIKNIGRFEDFSAVGDIQFHNLSLVYGENGRGKTTLCAVLRSLQSQDPTHIISKQTLGLSGYPEAKILLGIGVAQFKSGSWDTREPNLEIFDSCFVNENVFSGDHVDLEHRRNLLRFVLGSEGIGYAHQNDEIDAAIKLKNSEIKGQEKVLSAYINGKRSVDRFLALPSIPDIDNQIAAKTAEEQRLLRADAVTKHQELSALCPPVLELSSIQAVLDKQLDDLSIEAVRKAREYFESSHASEQWVEQGMNLAGDGSCPFCGADINENDRMDAFRRYFSREYATLKSEITETERNLSGAFSPSIVSGLRTTIEMNQLLLQFWSDYVQTQLPNLDSQSLERRLEGVRNCVLGYLRQKQNTPLDRPQTVLDLTRANNDYRAIISQINDYNHGVHSINSTIAKIKADVGAANLVQCQAELESLKLNKARYDPSIAQACTYYSELLAEKEKLSQAKKETKLALDQYTTGILEKYETSINAYLERFGANFRIVETKPGFSGGKSGSQYCLEINQQRIDLGDAKTVDAPCFKTALSDGDKNALAFAFFVSRLDRDQDLANKVVVIDDPISSMDNHRTQTTCQVILRLARCAAQVIVLSHDPHFLARIRQEAIDLPIALLHLTRVGQQTAIAEWDIDADTEPEYFKNYGKLADFLEKGPVSDCRDIVRCIRPLLETNLRMRYPRDFHAGEWLGDYLERIRNATPSDRYYSLRQYLDELGDMNEFSKRYHHGSNSSAESESLSDTELQSFVRRTLALVGG